MRSHMRAADERTAGKPEPERLLEQYGCGPIPFTGTGDALYERHLMFDNVLDVAALGPRERFEAAARAVRHVLSQAGSRRTRVLVRGVVGHEGQNESHAAGTQLRDRGFRTADRLL